MAKIPSYSIPENCEGRNNMRNKTQKFTDNEKMMLDESYATFSTIDFDILFVQKNIEHYDVDMMKFYRKIYGTQLKLIHEKYLYFLEENKIE